MQKRRPLTRVLRWVACAVGLLSVSTLVTRVCVCQDNRRARGDRDVSQSESVASTASADDDEDNQEDSEGTGHPPHPPPPPPTHLTRLPARTHSHMTKTQLGLLNFFLSYLGDVFEYFCLWIQRPKRLFRVIISSVCFQLIKTRAAQGRLGVRRGGKSVFNNQKAFAAFYEREPRPRLYLSGCLDRKSGV